MKASDILALLPIKPEAMPKIATSTQEPTRLTLKQFQECIQDQAMAITSATEPMLGFLGLVLKDESYSSINNGTSYNLPVDPGAGPVHANNATAAQITETSRLFTIEREQYRTYCEFQVILVSMITNCCPEKYLTALKHPITKFRQCTPLQLLDHLWIEYGTITSNDLTMNYAQMTAQWNPPTPIEDLFLQLREGQLFATEGSETIDDTQLLRLCYDNVNKTGLFNDALKIWRNKPVKTYALFTAYMTREHEDRMKNQTTSSGAGYSANNVTTITDIVHNELAQFVNNMPFFQQETSNDENANPNVPPEQANAALTADELKEIFKSMMSEFKNDKRGGGAGRNRKPLPPAQGTDEEGNKTTYCWSHGITTNLHHHSKTCKRPKEGHKEAATLQNKMGGSTDLCKNNRRNNNN